MLIRGDGASRGSLGLITECRGRYMSMAVSGRGLHVDNAIKRWQTELLDLTKLNRLPYSEPRSGALPLTHHDAASFVPVLIRHGWRQGRAVCFGAPMVV